MTAFSFRAPDVAFTAAWLAVGMVIGAFYFLSLRWNVGMLAAGRSILQVMAVQLGRFAVIGVALAAIAGNFGALALFAVTAGILAARSVIIRLEV